MWHPYARLGAYCPIGLAQRRESPGLRTGFVRPTCSDGAVNRRACRSPDGTETPGEAPLHSDGDVTADVDAAAVRILSKTASVATRQLLLPVPEAVRVPGNTRRDRPPATVPGRQPSGSRQSGSTPASEVPRLLLSVSETARALGICRSSLYTLIARRQVRSVSIGRRRLIPAEAVEEFVRHLSHASQP